MLTYKGSGFILNKGKLKSRKYLSELKRIYGEELNLYLDTKISKGNIKSFDLTEVERSGNREKILKEVIRFGNIKIGLGMPA